MRDDLLDRQASGKARRSTEETVLAELLGLRMILLESVLSTAAKG